MVRRSRILRYALAGLLAASAAGCQSYVFEPVSPAIIAVSNTTYHIKDNTKADILFVVDDSGSMAGEQSNLAKNFGAFITTIENANAKRKANGQKPIDFRIAVTNTSVTQNWIDQVGQKHHNDYYEIPQNYNCVSAYNLTTGTPYPAGKFMAIPGNQAILDSTTMSDAEIVKEFQQNVEFGVCGSGQEQGLLAAKDALIKQPSFVRKDSKLLIVLISDEQDCSDPGNDVYVGYTPDGDECVAQAALPNGGKLESVQSFVDFFNKTVAAQNASVALGAIVSAIKQPNGSVTPGVCDDPKCDAACGAGDPTKFPCFCGASDAYCQSQCVPSNAHTYPCYCGGTSPGSRYLNAADDIPGSLTDSICQDDFSNTLQKLAEIVSIPDRIILSATPHNNDPSLILLEITRADGTQVVCKAPKKGQTCADGVDWAYDPGPPPAIQLCNQAGSKCKLEPGDSYKVSFVQEACTSSQPCN